MQADLFVSASSGVYRARTELKSDDVVRGLAPSGAGVRKRIRCQVDAPFLEGQVSGGQCVVWWRVAHDVIGPWGAYRLPFRPVPADQQGRWSLHAAHPPERIDLIITGPGLRPQRLMDREVDLLDLVKNPVKMR